LAKHILNTPSDESDYVLIGINCAENQYVLSSLINEVLKTDFFLSDYVPFNLKEGRMFKFSLYRFLDENLGLEYFLIPNTSNFEEPNLNLSESKDLFAGQDIDERVKLINELPKTDYFLIMKGEDLHNYQFKVIEKLKTRSEIIQIQAIEPKELPSRRNLIF
jgi:hypothetical protein